MPRIIFPITNDITYDQRMHRICTSLHNNGFEVILVGKKLKNSIALNRPYQTKRLHCFYKYGKFFYIEYNLRLFFYLLFQRFDIVCANDLDTVLPSYWVAKLRKKKIVFDAHEYFTEMEEVVRRPRIQALWEKIETITVPHIRFAYTVNESLATIFSKKFNTTYQVIRNAPLLEDKPAQDVAFEKPYLIYSGAVNEGRGLEQILHAMKEIDLPLLICGEGNQFESLLALCEELGLKEKITFLGFVQPDKLRHIIKNAFAGFNLLTNNGKSYYYSLANKFFDYMHAEIPQICANFPEYQHINKQHEIAMLISLQSEQIAQAINKLLADQQYYELLVNNCKKAKLIYNWQEEEKKLVEFYTNVSHA